MQELSEYTKRHWDVVVIGGGATGAGTLRDLAMRGVKGCCSNSATSSTAQAPASTACSTAARATR